MKIASSVKPSYSTSTSSFKDFAIMSDDSKTLNCDINGKLLSTEIFSDHSVIFMHINCDRIQMIEPNSIKNFKKTN